MTDRDKGGPAFPFEYHNQTSRHQPGFFGTGDIAPGASQQFAGMTLRDYFAAKALPSILSPNPVTGQYALVTDFEECAITAYKMADAMLKARFV